MGRIYAFWSDFWVGDHGPFHLVSHAKISEYEEARPISDFFDEHGWKWDLFAHLLPPDIFLAEYSHSTV